MPITEDARIKEIAAKVKGSNETHTVQWQNQLTPLPVITIAVDHLVLNPRSHRIRAQTESHADADLLRDAPFSDQAQDLVAKFLGETPEFDALKANLKEDGQLEAGIATHAGVLINGNTRAVALRDLGEEYIRTAILPDGATEPEWSELEARLQLARDYKQEYSLTNELLFVHEQIGRGMSSEDLALLLGKAPSRNKAQLAKGVQEIEKSVRILQHIRDVQTLSEGTIRLTFFDEHESALDEADRLYIGLQEKNPAQAERMRNGRMTGVLVGVTYRNLRMWDSDSFVAEYVAAEFDEADELVAASMSRPAEARAGSDEFGVAFLEDSETQSDATFPYDPDAFLRLAARVYGTPEAEEIAPGLTKGALYQELESRLTSATEEKAEERKEEKKRLTPIKLVREARAKLQRAQSALKRARGEPHFKKGALDYEVNKVRQELEALAKASSEAP